MYEMTRHCPDWASVAMVTWTIDRSVRSGWAGPSVVPCAAISRPVQQLQRAAVAATYATDYIQRGSFCAGHEPIEGRVYPATLEHPITVVVDRVQSGPERRFNLEMGV
jgi:hypothetical protein